LRLSSLLTWSPGSPPFCTADLRIGGAVAARKQKAGTKRKRMPARTVEDEDYHLRHERVAGIDVAKASGMICLRLPPEGGQGKRFSRVWEAGATVPEAEAVAQVLLAAGVELVSMESTSDYWRTWVRHEVALSE
jgi:hypothetical protein